MDEKEKAILTYQRKAMEESERNKTKRSIFVVLFYSVAWFLLICIYEKITPNNIVEVIAGIAGCVFLGGITFYVNTLIFSQMYTMSEAENAKIRYYENLLKEYDKLKAQIRSDSCGTNQP